MTMISKLPFIAAALSATVLMPAQAWAEERVCSGSIAAETVDNLRVPQNATCTLIGTRVMGTIQVQTNARLFAEDIIVIGNVQAEGARQVNVMDGSRIGGSVQVVQGRGATVSDSRVSGDILYDSNTGALRVLRNQVDGNVQAFQNTGGVNIRRNVIDENLQCTANNPAPTGGANIVGGNKENQCAGL